MTGLSRVAVFGAGRSGVAAAEAVLVAGGEPTVYEEASEDKPKVAESARELRAKGVEVTSGWKGEFAETGCDLVVASPGVGMRHRKLQDAVAAGLEVVSEIELAYRISRAPIVAITGTNGKSTTTVMTWLCLRAAGVDAVLCGNVYGSGYDEIPLTQAASQSTPDQVLVAEVSSFQLEWVVEFKPVAATITNIAPDHLDRYADFEEYAATKHRIFARQCPKDTAVVKIGDPVVRPPEGSTVKGYGTRDEGSGNREQGLTMRRQGPDAYATEDGIVVEGVEIPFTGIGHDKLNAMAAMLLADGALRSRGRSDITDLAEGLKRFKGLAHRMERVGERNGILVVNNSMCTNPMAVESSSRSLEGRRHVLMGGVNKMLGFHELARYMQEAGDEAYLYGRDAEQIAEQLDVMDAARKHVFGCLDEAFSDATQRAKAGETIILSPGCASFDQFEDFRQRGDHFRRIAKEWLTK